jgi:hypothetical protein
MTHVDMKSFIKNGIKVFSGRQEGSSIRKKLNLDEYDNNDEIVCINIPDFVWSMNSSFFLSCFGDSIRKLGKEKFKTKYIFNCDSIIQKQIEEGISQALKTSNVLDFSGGN